MEQSIKTFVAEDNAEIKYLDEGTGQPILYIYGMGSSLASQAPFVKLMSEHCRIIVFDQRGYGITEGVGELGVHQSAKDARALMAHLGIEKYILLGYSMGAAVVFSYVKQFGCEKLKKVLLGDMSPKLINENGWDIGLYQGHYTRTMYEADLDVIKTDYKRFALYLTEQLMFQSTPEQSRSVYGTAEEIRTRIQSRTHNPLIAQALFGGLVDVSPEQQYANYFYWSTMAGADFRDILKDICVPTAVIYADPGSGYCPATAKYMSTQIPDCSLFAMQDCSHMGAAENAAQYTKYLFDFCEI